MKRFTIALVFGLVFFTSPVLANYIENMHVRITQPNGEIINCFASGDEFYNWLHDANGFTIVKNPKDII